MPKKQASGGARLKASGRTGTVVGLTDAEREIILAAAEIERVPLTQFLIRSGLASAEKILKKNRVKPLT